MILIVNLDLRGPSASYNRLYEELQKQGTWWHHMRWTWLLDTERTPSKIVDVLRPYVHSNLGDRVLVCRLARPYQGLLAKEEWSWISEHLEKSNT